MPKFCKYCGDPITEGELFCDNCGKRIEGETPPPHPVCARCGAELNPASKFCRSCGAPVSGTPSPRPAAGRTPPPPPVARRPPPLPRATTPSGLPPAPAPAPIPSAPAAPPEKRRKKGCCGCVFGFVSVVLVVLGVAALGIMAFYHPGFLLKDKEESLDDILERMASEGSIESFLNTDFAITKETSPGNPRLIKTTWSELDVKGSEVFVADVAPDAGSVTLETSDGTVGVDFTFLNPEEKEDALIVRILPELHDANSGMTLHGYDFSLESGRRVFAARNRITIPRHAPDNKDGQVYYYNPKTREYEFVYSEVSEDGKSYHAYLDHFSIVVEGIPDYFHPAKNSTRILYHEPDEDKKWPVMARSVAVSDKDLKNWMEKSRIDLLEVCKKGVKPPDGLAVFIDTVSGWDAAKSASEDFMKIVTCADRLKFGNCLLSTGHALLLAKITYQLRKAPSKNFYKVIKQNKWDLAAAGSLAAIKLAGLGTIGVPIGTAIIATSLTWNSFGLLQYARAYFGDPPIVLTWRDAGYQRFLRYWYTPLEIGNVRYGVSFWTHHADNVGATTPRQIMESSGIELLENRDYMYLTVRDILLKNKNDPEALQTDLETLKIKYLRYFWNLEPETRRDWCYKDYREAFYALNHPDWIYEFYGHTDDEVERKLHAKYLEEYKDPDKDTINSYIETHEAYIDKCIQSRVRAVLWEDFCQKQETLKKLLADKVLPAFNDRIYFFVKDSNLPEGTHFDQSPYSAYHKNREIKDYGRYMWFLDAKGKPVETGSYGEYAFYPNNADKSDYGEEARQPYPRENSDFVFHCSRYHFMQMGAPGWLVLHGRLDWPEVRIPIEIPPPDGSGTTRVELVIPKQSLQNALQKFSGVWRPVADLEKRGLPTSWVTAFIYFPKHNEFCEYEGAERAQSNPGSWTEIRKFDYDKKTGILTIDYRLNNPDGGTGIATYRINHEGRLLMHNAQTGEDSVWTRVATQSGWPEMEKDMDDFLKKVREAAAKKPTDNKPRGTSGVVVGGVIRIGNE